MLPRRAEDIAKLSIILHTLQIAPSLSMTHAEEEGNYKGRG
jgi:hypothetical protein